jgi:hypothetical protein
MSFDNTFMVIDRLEKTSALSGFAMGMDIVSAITDKKPFLETKLLSFGKSIFLSTPILILFKESELLFIWVGWMKEPNKKILITNRLAIPRK